MKTLRTYLLVIIALSVSILSVCKERKIYCEVEPNYIPVLRNNDQNPVLRLFIESEGKSNLNAIELDFEGSTNHKDIKFIEVFSSGKDTVFRSNKPVIKKSEISETIEIRTNFKLEAKKSILWISVDLHDNADLLNILRCRVNKLSFSNVEIKPSENGRKYYFRYGHAIRKFGQDGIHTSRIPGLATSSEGTLMAIYDARRELGRDLQGDIDIGMNRSFDFGNTWEPIQVVMDMNEWGGMPEKFNGVSDASILVNGKDIFIAGLWMHGILDDNGIWKSDLSEKSTAWNHQWRNKGSQPGFDPKQTSQFLLVKSEDNGNTWGEPVNLTKMCKKEEWWLWAPAPGRGIVMEDGTLVFPTQGRDKTGVPFSNITYSKDGGKTWKTSNPASHNTTECSVAEYEEGSLMLNIRDNRNRKDKSETNGRAVFTTDNLGETWKEHKTSHHTFIEPVCMASLHKHYFSNNRKKDYVLLFSNPNSKFNRVNQTIKMSFDNGNTWPQEKWILLDQGKGSGYSCITSINENTLGIIYEGSRAQIIYQKIDLSKFFKFYSNERRTMSFN